MLAATAGNAQSSCQLRWAACAKVSGMEDIEEAKVSSLHQLRTVVFLPSGGWEERMGNLVSLKQSGMKRNSKRAFHASTRESTSCRAFFNRAVSSGVCVCVSVSLTNLYYYFFFLELRHPPAECSSASIHRCPAIREGAKFHHLPRNATPPREGPKNCQKSAPGPSLFLFQL